MINTQEDLQKGLDLLCRNEPRFAAIARHVGPLPLRRRSADFSGLVQIITGQQLSIASAAAIFGRLEERFSPLTIQTIQTLDNDHLAKAGLSRPKIATIRAAVDACETDAEFANLCTRPANEIHKALCEIKGIGRWSADIFLLFCLGDPDIFPSSDLALRIAAHDAFALDERPTVNQLDDMARAWQPWRSIAARLLWAWYGHLKKGQASLPM